MKPLYMVDSSLTSDEAQNIKQLAKQHSAVAKSTNEVFKYV